MSEQFLALVPVFGVPAIALAVFLSCLGIPIPAAIIMLVGGSLSASGDLQLWPILLACVVAASCADQIGYWTGRLGGTAIIERFAQRGPKRQRLVDRSRNYLSKHGVSAIFLTRWLLAMIGPYINPVAGAAGMRWKAFSISAIVGQNIWVLIYVLLGYAFSKNIIAVAQIAGNASGFLAAGVVTLFLGWHITRTIHGSFKNGRKRFIKPRGRL